MKGATPFTVLTTKVSFILLVCTIYSCSPLKNLSEDQWLLRKNEIIEGTEKRTDEAVYNLLIQQPNTYIFGSPLKLNISNLSKKKPGSDTWLNRIGEQAVLIDQKSTNRSIERLQAYYKSLGYFNASVKAQIIGHHRKQKATVRYQIDKGRAFIIDSIKTIFYSPDLDSLYKNNKGTSFIQKGKPFNYERFDAERDRISKLAKDNGIYNFQESAVGFSISRDTVQKNKDSLLTVVLSVRNPKENNETASERYLIRKIKRVNLYTDIPYNTPKVALDSIEHNGITIFFKDKLHYKPKAITDPVYLVEGAIYGEYNRQLTYRKMSSLNTFKYPNISISEIEGEPDLLAEIYLNSKDTYAAQVNLDVTHSNIQRLGLAFSSSLTARNIFGGAEILSLSGRGSIGVLGDAALSSEKYLSEIGVDVNLNIPNLWFPFISLKGLLSKNSLPQTKISLGTSFQKNIGLDKQTLNATYGFNWAPNDFLKFNASLIEVQYVQNLNPERFFSVYGTTYNRLNTLAQDYTQDPVFEPFFDPTITNNGELTIPQGAENFIETFLNTQDNSSEQYKEIQRIEERKNRLIENNLISSSQLTLIKNNKKEITDPDFYQFRAKIESAGNLLSLLSNVMPIEENESGTKLIAGVPYAQYIKTELDFIKHWRVGRDQVLAFRSFGGIAIPYLNASTIPFARSYFAGGSNDNRAWNAYALGPGSTNNLNDFNEANFKLAFNLEYRFPLLGAIKGALFTDAGNIWNALDGVNDPERSFQGISSLQQIAIGSGFGVRYDFTYFVFRLDVGFKTYNPSLENSKRWFRDYNFANSVINIGINYPF